MLWIFETDNLRFLYICFFIRENQSFILFFAHKMGDTEEAFYKYHKNSLPLSLS